MKKVAIAIAETILLSGAILLWPKTASAQDYPVKPIRVITGPVGGGGDFQTRTIAQGIAGPLGQPLIVDNRPNNLHGEVGSKAPPDGYTLILTGGSFWSLPLLTNVSYDPIKDFSPITLVERSPNLLVVHPTLPVKSVKELIALAKARPGQLNYSSPASDTRLYGELFKAMAGINFVIVPYSNNQTAYNDLLTGQIQLTFGNINTLTPHIKAGRLRVLAVTTPKPSAMFPQLPTVAETVPGFEKTGMAAMFAPAKTPDFVIKRINQEVVRYLSTPDAKQRFMNVGAEAVSSSPEELASTIKSETARLTKVIKDAGIQPQ